MQTDNKPIRAEVLAALSQTPEIAEQLKAVAQAIADDAKKLAPKKSGNLSRNIGVERDYNSTTGSVQYLVGWTKRAFYGPLVELGSSEEPPRPHLVPAANKNGGQAPKGGAA